MSTLFLVSQITRLSCASLIFVWGWFPLAPAVAQFRDPIGPYNSPEQDPNGVQERGIPPQGVIVQGDQLKAAPGYVLEKGENNQMTARQKAGGGTSPSFNCGCAQGTGNCSAIVSGGGLSGVPTDVAVCAKSANGPCSGQCGWTFVPTKVEPPRGR